MNVAVALTFFSSGLILSFGIFLFVRTYRIPIEKNKARELAQLAEEGLRTYLGRVLSSIFQIIFYLTSALLLFTFLFQKQFSWIQILSFLMGGSVMALNSYASLIMAPKLIPRILAQSKDYFPKSLQTAFDSNTSIGFILIGITVLGFVSAYQFLGVESVIGYTLGIVLSAFFLRIGGGMVKTAAEIGSDLVTKVEKKIPEFDVRNPATLLDIIGDFIGNIMGYGSDLLSSFAFSLSACVLFAFALNEKLFELPFYIVSVALLASVVAYGFCRFRIASKKYENVLLEGIYLGVILSGLATFVIMRILKIDLNISSLWGGVGTFQPFPPYLIGLVGAVVIGFTAEFLTSNLFKSTRKIAQQAEYGPVITLFNGLSLGQKSGGLFLIYLIAVVVPSFYFAGFYGIAMASMGMLTMTGLILSTNIFDPLAVNAYKIAKLSESSQTTIRNAQKLAQIGNTTAALGNGFASGAAVLSTFSLFFSLLLIAGVDLSYLLLVDILLFVGLIIGLTLPFVFSGFLLNGLKTGILAVITEVSRQFRDIPYLYEGKARPDIIKASDLISIIAMNAMVVPAFLMALAPISIGYIFGVKMLLGVALGTLLTGLTQSFFWGNLGDALHNARTFIEGGHFGGKNSPTFEKIQTADNIGDAFKDLLSPSINILIKCVTIIAIVVILFLNL